MKTGIGNVTDIIINQCINEFNKKETRNKINKKIINPVIKNINRKILPYFCICLLFMIIILILLIFILHKLK